MSGDGGDEREFDADSGFGPAPGAGGGDSASKMRAALSEVRREARKVAFLHALLDAALVALAVNVALRLVRPNALDGAVSLPGFLAGAGGVVPNAVHAAAFVGLALGAAAFVGEYLLRTRRPLVEQFESGNPNVSEALRTARDSVEDGANTDMARRLYGDVLAGLRETSSFELVETRRVVVTTFLVVVIGLASIQVAVVDLTLAETLNGGGDAGDASGDPYRTEADEELRDGDLILGDPENVSAGEEILNASVQGTGEGEGDTGSTSPPAAYDDGGFADAAVESQEAGYAEPENVEDAELIREYNLRIRDDDEEDDT